MELALTVTRLTVLVSRDEYQGEGVPLAVRIAHVSSRALPRNKMHEGSLWACMTGLSLYSRGEQLPPLAVQWGFCSDPSSVLWNIMAGKEISYDAWWGNDCIAADCAGF